tara:strand:- start:12663 stop:16178 length:3516 start_codon:yes stop_codon:yes gene_type:complete
MRNDKNKELELERNEDRLNLSLKQWFTLFLSVVFGYFTASAFSDISLSWLYFIPSYKVHILLSSISIVFLVFVILFLFKFYKLSYRVGFWEICGFLYLTNVYIGLRLFFNSEKWFFINIFDFKHFTYVDVVAIAALLSFLIIIVRSIFFKRDNTTKNNTFLEDNPISTKKLKEDNTYNHLISKIAPALFKDVYDSSFSIGVIGPWGTGKSSFLKAVEHTVCEASEKELKDNYDIDHKPDTIFIEFSPFLNHNEEQVIHEFFTQLSNKLSERSGRLSNLITVYSEKLANLEDKNPWFSLFKLARNSRESRSAQELYDQIEDCIRELEIKIIVAVDDLDRLNAQEILQVLKLIRNTSNFPNMVFLVALDKEYVINALKEEKDYMKESYVDKFFQYEVHVTIEIREKLIQKTKDLLKQSLSKVLKDKDYLGKIISSFQTLEDVHLFISNYRDVVRFVNQFLIDFTISNVSYTALEIENRDLFRLTILKLFAPSLLRDLKMNAVEEIGQRDDSEYNILFLKSDHKFKNERFRIDDFKLFGINIKNNKVIISDRSYSTQVGLVFLELFAVKYEVLYLIENKGEIKLSEVKYKDNLNWYFTHNKNLHFSYSIESLFNIDRKHIDSELKDLLPETSTTDVNNFNQELKNLLSKVAGYEGKNDESEAKRKAEIILEIVNRYGVDQFNSHLLEEVLLKLYKTDQENTLKWFYETSSRSEFSENTILNFLLKSSLTNEIDLDTKFKSKAINKFLIFIKEKSISKAYYALTDFYQEYERFDEIKSLCRSKILLKVNTENDVISFAKCFIIQRSFNSSFYVDPFFHELIEDISEVTTLFERIGQGESEKIKTIIEFMILSVKYDLGSREDLYFNLNFLDPSSMGKAKESHFYYQIYLSLKNKEVVEMFESEDVQDVIGEFEYSNSYNRMEKEGIILYHFIMVEEKLPLYEKLFNVFRRLHTRRGVINAYDSTQVGPAFTMNNDVYAECLSYQKIYFSKQFNLEKKDNTEKLIYNLTLREKLTLPELVMISNDLLFERLKKTNDFKSKRVFMFLNIEKANISWATAHLDKDNKFNYKIQGLQVFQENELIDKYYKDSKENTYWIDTNMPGSLMKLNNDEIFITYFSDGSSLKEEVYVEKQKGLTKYRFKKEKVKEEYFTVDENNQFVYYSEGNPFLELREFKLS